MKREKKYRKNEVYTVNLHLALKSLVFATTDFLNFLILKTVSELETVFKKRKFRKFLE